MKLGILLNRRLFSSLRLLKRIVRTRSDFRVKFALAVIPNCSVKCLFAFQPLGCSLTSFLLSFGLLKRVVDCSSRLSICPRRCN